MKVVKQTLLCTLVAASLTSTAVFAQEQKSQTPAMPAAPEQAAPQMDVSDQQVDNFADAYVAVQTLSQQYGAKLQQTQDAEKSQQLQQQAQDEMQSAITDTGLSLNEYKQIARAANESETLRQRITVAVNELIQADAPEESES